MHSLLVLGPEDGRGNLSDVARDLCELVVQHRAAVGEIDSSFINSKLIGKHTCAVIIVGGKIYVYLCCLQPGQSL